MDTITLVYTLVAEDRVLTRCMSAKELHLFGKALYSNGGDEIPHGYIITKYTHKNNTICIEFTHTPISSLAIAKEHLLIDLSYITALE